MDQAKEGDSEERAMLGVWVCAFEPTRESKTDQGTPSPAHVTHGDVTWLTPLHS